jgi:hypothetical protein
VCAECRLVTSLPHADVIKEKCLGKRFAAEVAHVGKSREVIVDSYYARYHTRFTLQQSVSRAAASSLSQLTGTECPRCSFASSADKLV